MCPAQAARSPALPAVLALSLSVTAAVHSARALHDFMLRRGVHCLNRPLGAELSAAHVPSGERQETRPGRASTGHRVQGERVGRARRVSRAETHLAPGRALRPPAPRKGGDQSHPRCLRGRARTPQLSVHANYGTHCCRRRGPARSASRPFIEKSANPSSTPGVSKKVKARPAM